MAGGAKPLPEPVLTNHAWGNIHIRVISQEMLRISTLDMGYIFDIIAAPPRAKELTHWDRVTHICVSKSIIIGSDNDVSVGRRQVIIGTNAGILLIGPSGKISVKFQSNFKHFQWRKCVWKCRLQNVGHLVSISMCQYGIGLILVIVLYDSSSAGEAIGEVIITVTS